MILYSHFFMYACVHNFIEETKNILRMAFEISYSSSPTNKDALMLLRCLWWSNNKLYGSSFCLEFSWNWYCFLVNELLVWLEPRYLMIWKTKSKRFFMNVMYLCPHSPKPTNNRDEIFFSIWSVGRSLSSPLS